MHRFRNSLKVFVQPQPNFFYFPSVSQIKKTDSKLVNCEERKCVILRRGANSRPWVQCVDTQSRVQRPLGHPGALILGT